MAFDLRVVKEGSIAQEIADAIAAQKGVANGVAPLDGNAKVPVLHLPGGAGSNVDADTVDGRHASDLAPVVHDHDAAYVNVSGDAMTGPLSLLGDPTSGDHAARRSWVENYFAAKDQKENVRTATTQNHTLSGTLAIGGVNTQVGDRVLVKNQTNAAENGVYVVQSGAWTRAPDAEQGELTSGAFVYVSEGTNAGTSWWVTTPDPITVGTTPITWAQFGGPGAIQAGTGLSRNGNTISASFGSNAGTVAQGNDPRLREVRDEGTAIANRPVLDFVGPGVSVTDDSAGSRTVVTVPGASSGTPVGHLRGANLSWNSGTSYSVSAGEALVNGVPLSWSSAITRTGVPAFGTNTVVYVYLYSASGTPAVLESATPPVYDLALDYHKLGGASPDASRRCIGSYVTDGSGAIRRFSQVSDGRTREQLTLYPDQGTHFQLVASGASTGAWEQMSLANHVPAHATHWFCATKLAVTANGDDGIIAVSPVDLGSAIANFGPYTVRDRGTNPGSWVFFGRIWVPFQQAQVGFYRLNRVAGSPNAVVECHGARWRA